jgi:hypothetical protein
MTCGCNRPKDTLVASSVKPCSQCIELKGTTGTPSVIEPIRASDFRTFQSVIPVTRVGGIIPARGLSMSTSLTTYATAYRPSGSPGVIVTSGVPVVPTGVASGILASGVGGTKAVPTPDLSTDPPDSERCCPITPGLNLRGPLVCGPDLGSFSAKEREARGPTNGPGLKDELRVPKPPKWYRATTAGPSPDGSQWFYEAYCRIAHTPFDHCGCTATQTIELTEGNDAMIDSFLQALAAKYDQETTKDRLNDKFNPHEYLYPPDPKDPRAGPTCRRWDKTLPPKPPFPVGQGKKLNDYIQAWIKECCPDETRDYIAIADAPGGYSPRAKGNIHFNITFEKGSIEIHRFCAQSRCGIDFDLVVTPRSDEEIAKNRELRCRVDIRNVWLNCDGMPLTT